MSIQTRIIVRPIFLYENVTSSSQTALHGMYGKPWWYWVDTRLFPVWWCNFPLSGDSVALNQYFWRLHYFKGFRTTQITRHLFSCRFIFTVLKRQSEVYADHPRTVTHLWYNISRDINNIDINTFLRIFENIK